MMPVEQNENINLTTIKSKNIRNNIMPAKSKLYKDHNYL